MKILICPDSFKGTMSASEAAEAIAEGLRSTMPEAALRLLPVGDGGEGTVNALCTALGNVEVVECETTDPLGRRVIASYAVTGSGTALIESAAASGLTLIDEADRDIMKADTYGTGLLIADAWRRGVRDFIICMGGTATCDGGFGARRAMIECGIPSLDNPAVARLEEKRFPRFTLLCDVDNPFCGPRGAAAVFGPQKGASPQQIPLLDSRLKTLASEYAKVSDIDVTDMNYAGAAGGLAGMLMACYGATPVSGISKVLQLMDFEKQLEDADLVVTGEGRADATTLNGKAAKGILDISGWHGVPVVLIGGQVADRDRLLTAGFHQVIQATPDAPDSAVAPGEYLTRAARTLQPYPRNFCDNI